jgi:hypothetical protein
MRVSGRPLTSLPAIVLLGLGCGPQERSHDKGEGQAVAERVCYKGFYRGSGEETRMRGWGWGEEIRMKEIVSRVPLMTCGSD